MVQMQNAKVSSERVAHILAWRDDAIAQGTLGKCVAHIEGGTGSPSGCLRILMTYAEVFAMAAWYESHDLAALKTWLYARAKLEHILMNPPYGEAGVLAAYENRALHGLFPLISDHPGLIDWYSKLDGRFDARRVANPKAFEFWTKQFFLALRGEWDVLVERSESIIANPPSASREKKFLIDHEFYIALARGDVDKMQSTIEELISPKVNARRIALEEGFRAGLISTPAVIYGKLAYRHGYEIVVESPYVPLEWLSIAPLAEYVDPFDFMIRYEVE